MPSGVSIARPAGIGSSYWHDSQRYSVVKKRKATNVIIASNRLLTDFHFTDIPSSIFVIEITL